MKIARKIVSLVYEERPWKRPSDDKIKSFAPRLAYALAETLWMASVMIILTDIVFMPILWLRWGYIPGLWLNLSPIVAMPISYFLARVVLHLPASGKRFV